jgi:hypothetical protein
MGGLLSREVGQLLTLYPTLHSAATQRQGDFVMFRNPSRGCQFLDPDNRCRIEKKHGKSLKPAVCTLFPFNSFTRIGKALAVSPHFLCPLRVIVPARPGQVHGTHSEVERAVLDSGLAESNPLDLQVTPAPLHPSEGPASTLKREVHFRDACSAALGQVRFIDILRSASVDSGRFDELLARAAALLGLATTPRAAPSDTIDQLLLALAPAFRLRLLHLPSEGILRALALGELWVRQTSTLSRGTSTPQEIYETLSAAAPALALLARGEGPISFPRNARKRVQPFGDPQLTFAAHRVLSAGSGSRAALDTLEEAMTNLTTAADRTVFLIELGSQLQHPRPKRERKQQASLAANS